MWLDTILDFTYRPSMWWSLIPALINLGILVYVIRGLPKNKTTKIFLLFVVTLIMWQMSDTLTRIANSPQTAEFWFSFFDTSAFITALGLHFVLLYTRNRWALDNRLPVIVYGFSAFLHLTLITDLFRTSSENFVLTRIGWVRAGSFPIVYSSWIAILAFVMLLLLIVHAYRNWNDHRQRNVALLLLFGFAIPTITGTFNQIVLPELGYLQIPVTSSMMSTFSIAAIVALKKYDFLVASKDVIYAHLDAAVFSIDRDGIIRHANTTAALLLGRQLSQIIGRSYEVVLKIVGESKKSTARWHRVMNRALKSKSKYTAGLEKSYYCRRVDGSYFPIAMSISPIVTNDSIEGVVLTIRDITSDMEVSRAKDEFVSMAAHELQGPPFVMHWFIDKLREDDGNFSDKQRGYLQRLDLANTRFTQLITDLLLVSRIERGELVLNFSTVEVNELVQSVIDSCELSLRENKIQLDYQPLTSSVMINTDVKQLEVALHHVLNNAIKYSREGGTVLLAVSVREATVTFQITDTGSGIPSQEQHRIFSKMFRAQNAVEIDPDGFGMGLYITKHIIDGLKGTITFESSYQQGTTFTITIPREIDD